MNCAHCGVTYHPGRNTFQYCCVNQKNYCSGCHPDCQWACRPADCPTTYGEILREYRESTGLNVRGFAQKIGMSPSQLSRIETGALKPPLARSSFEYHMRKITIGRGSKTYKKVLAACRKFHIEKMERRWRV